jgi:hypothetical protein
VEDLGAACAGFGEGLGATGWIMNSWMSTLLSACSPPLMMFIIGTGMEYRPGVPLRSAMCAYSGTPAFAAALAAARDTARMALAPSVALFSVPSRAHRAVQGLLVEGPCPAGLAPSGR